MSTRTEKIRKLRALAHSGSGAFPHEAAVALRMAEALEAKTPNAKAVAQAVAKVLKERGMTVRVRRRAREDDWRGYYWQGIVPNERVENQSRRCRRELPQKPSLYRTQCLRFPPPSMADGTTGED
jgi:hypothetical protein